MAPKKTAKKRSAPMKDCPKCKKKVHARKTKCDCGYEFPKPEPKAKSTGSSSASSDFLGPMRKRREELQKQLADIDKLKEELEMLDADIAKYEKLGK